MVARDENGKFVKGNGGGPGRPTKAREERYREVLLTTVTFEKWERIVSKACDQALKGDASARNWLAGYLVGLPAQKTELTGAEGGAVTLKVVYEGKDNAE